MSNPFTRKEVTLVKTNFKQRIKDYSPDRRIELISQKAKLRDIKLEQTKRTKTALLLQKKTAQQMMLQAKFKKFDLRMNKPVRVT